MRKKKGQDEEEQQCEGTGSSGSDSLKWRHVSRDLEGLNE